MDILEQLFSVKTNGSNGGIETEENGEEELNEESGSEIEDEEPPAKLYKYDKPKLTKRNRPERGKFTILNDGAEVAEPDRILDISFTPELLQKIFKDSSIQFLARYGIIPNMRECKVESCPKEQMMSLIKHANGYVWRCRSCRKRRERRVITKISVYEGTFLFYSRMPLNKFFIFMLIWCEHPGYTATEYNRLLGEYRLVEETIMNTIGFIRDHIQNWCQMQAIKPPEKLGGDGMIVELLDTFHTEDASAKHRNRRERHFTMRFLLICWKTNRLAIVNLPERQYTKQLLLDTVKEFVHEKSMVVMKDSLMEKFGEQQSLNVIFAGKYGIRTICDVWLNIDEEEKDRQFVKTLMESAIPTNGAAEPLGYEYYFRRRFLTKTFNHFLKAIRELYSQPSTANSP